MNYFPNIYKEEKRLSVSYTHLDVYKRQLQDTCPCGRTHLRIDRIKGRSDDMFIIKGVNIFPMQVEKVLAVSYTHLEIAGVINDSLLQQRLGYSKATIACLFIPETYQVYWNMSVEAVSYTHLL